jgi:hypothetical protein
LHAAGFNRTARRYRLLRSDLVTVVVHEQEYIDKFIVAIRFHDEPQIPRLRLGVVFQQALKLLREP